MNKKKNQKKFAAGKTVLQCQLCFETPWRMCRGELLCETSDNWHFVLHLMVALYVTDIPESEELLSVDRGNQTAMPCHMCQVEIEDFSSYSRVPRRCWENTIELISNHIENMKSTSHSAQFIEKMSLMSLSHVFVDFPSVGIHASVNVYASFRFGSMHNLSLEISRALKECLWNLLRDKTRNTGTIQSTCDFPKSFNAVKSAAVPPINWFLASSQQPFLGSGFRIDFNRPGKMNSLMVCSLILVLQGYSKLRIMKPLTKFFPFWALL